MKRATVDVIVKMCEHSRFSKGIFGWIGFRTYWLPYKNVERVAGETIKSGEADGLLASICPTSYVTESAPPTLLIHGARDTTVPIANAEALTEALEANGIPYDFYRLEHSDHSLLQNFFKHLSYYKLLVRYADTYLS